jgi:hypothetical protein
VNRLLAQHPEAATTSAFSKLLELEGAGSVLQWNGTRKIATLNKLVALLVSERIETEDELRMWLESPQNLMRLQVIDGIADKTAHYLQILVGIQGIAIDRHLQGFLAEAGVRCSTYNEARQVLDETASLLAVAPSDLDYSIWSYMSTRESRTQKRFCASR